VHLMARPGELPPEIPAYTSRADDGKPHESLHLLCADSSTGESRPVEGRPKAQGNVHGTHASSKSSRSSGLV
jgi:hypothetical protein